MLSYQVCVSLLLLIFVVRCYLRRSESCSGWTVWFKGNKLVEVQSSSNR